MTIRTSNGYPFIVTAAQTTDQTGIFLEVYDGDDPDNLIDVLPDSRAREWQEVLNGPGSASFEVHEFDERLAANPGILASGNIVRFYLNGVARFAMKIEGRQYEPVPAGEDGDSGRWIKVSGRGAIAVLDDGLVYQEGGIGSGNPASRTFDDKAGAIIRALLPEAQTRGAAGSVTTDFTDSTDSNSAPFTIDVTEEVRVGISLLALVLRHAQIAVDVRMLPNLTLQYFEELGLDRSQQLPSTGPVVLRRARNIVEESAQIDGVIRNAYLVQTPTGFQERLDAASILAYGRREGYLSLGQTTDGDYITAAVDAAFARTSDEAKTYTYEVLDVDGARPYVDWDLGDWVLGHNETGALERLRIRGITVKEDGQGFAKYIPEVGTLNYELEERLTRWLSSMTPGAGGGITAEIAEPNTVLEEDVDSIVGDAIDLHEAGADPHSPYLKADGSRALTGDLSAGGNVLTDLGAPTDPNDAARLDDLDSAAVVDQDAIHIDVADEFDTASQKASPVAADRVLLEDSENSLAKVYAELGDLPFGSGGGGGGGPEQSYVGTTTIGSSWLSLTNYRQYMQQITIPAGGALLAAVELYLQSTAANVANLHTAVWADDGGVPAELLSVAGPWTANAILPQDTTGSNPRWWSSAHAIWLPAGDYWIGFAVSDTTHNLQVAYESTGGAARYVDPANIWLSDGDYYSNSTPGWDLSLRASLIVAGQATTVGSLTYAERVAALGPDQWWPLDESSGTTAANARALGGFSPSSADGTYVGSPTLAAAGIDPEGTPCPDFDGTDDVVTLNDSLEGPPSSQSALAFACWIEPDDVTTRQVIMEVGGSSQGWQVYLRAGSLYAGLMYGGTWYGCSTPVSVDTVYHVAVVWTSLVSVALYLNGELAATYIHPNNSPFSVGTNQGGIGATVSNAGFDNGTGTTEFFDGKISQVAIWRRAFADWEIRWLYDQTSAVSAAATLGAILSADRVANTSKAATTIDTTWRDIDPSGSDPLTLSFTVPPSGKVLITIASLASAGIAVYGRLYDADAAAVVADTYQIIAPTGTGGQISGVAWYLEGLSPGVHYNWKPQIASPSGSGSYYTGPDPPSTALDYGYVVGKVESVP